MYFDIENFNQKYYFNSIDKKISLIIVLRCICNTDQVIYKQQVCNRNFHRMINLATNYSFERISKYCPYWRRECGNATGYCHSKYRQENRSGLQPDGRSSNEIG